MALCLKVWMIFENILKILLKGFSLLWINVLLYFSFRKQCSDYSHKFLLQIYFSLMIDKTGLKVFLENIKSPQN